MTIRERLDAMVLMYRTNERLQKEALDHHDHIYTSIGTGVYPDEDALNIQLPAFQLFCDLSEMKKLAGELGVKLYKSAAEDEVFFEYQGFAFCALV